MLNRLEKGEFNDRYKYYFEETIIYGLRCYSPMVITFGNGESPLDKEYNLKNSIFKWKYPLWYAEIYVEYYF